MSQLTTWIKRISTATDFDEINALCAEFLSSDLSRLPSYSSIITAYIELSFKILLVVSTNSIYTIYRAPSNLTSFLVSSWYCISFTR